MQNVLLYIATEVKPPLPAQREVIIYCYCAENTLEALFSLTSRSE